MPLSVNFSVTQSLADTSQLTFTDTSTGSDGTITTRRITILTSTGDYLVVSGTTTTYEVWALPLATPITLSVLTGATAPNITVQWLAGSTVVYTLTIPYDFPLDLYLAGYNLTRSVISKPNTVQDTNYYNNKIKLLVAIDDSETAIEIGEDIYNAQSSLDRGQYLVDNENISF